MTLGKNRPFDIWRRKGRKHATSHRVCVASAAPWLLCDDGSEPAPVGKGTAREFREVGPNSPALGFAFADSAELDSAWRFLT